MEQDNTTTSGNTTPKSAVIVTSLFICSSYQFWILTHCHGQISTKGLFTLYNLPACSRWFVQNTYI